MKKAIFASALSTLLSIAVVAQSPAPPPRAASPNPASSASTSGGGTGAEGKIAYLNGAQLNQGIFELKIKLDALNLEFEPKRKEIQAAEEELNNLKNKIQTQGGTVNPPVRNQWVEEAVEKEKVLKRKGEDYEALLQKRYVEVSQPINEKILKSLANYCQQHGIAIVFERGAADQTGFLIWPNPAADITDDFMKEYNKANPVVASSAAGAKKN